MLLSPHRHDTRGCCRHNAHGYFYTTAVVQTPRGHKFPPKLATELAKQDGQEKNERKRLLLVGLRFHGLCASSLFCFCVILIIKQFQCFFSPDAEEWDGGRLGECGLLSLLPLAQREEGSSDKRRPRRAVGWQEGFPAGPAIPSVSSGKRSCWRASLGSGGWRPRASTCRECSWCRSNPAAARGWDSRAGEGSQLLAAVCQAVCCSGAFSGSPSPGGCWSPRTALGQPPGSLFPGREGGMGSSSSWLLAGQLCRSPAPKSTPQDTTFGLKCQLCWNSALLDSARRIQALLNHFRDKHTADNGGCSLGMLFPVSMPGVELCHGRHEAHPEDESLTPVKISSSLGSLGAVGKLAP